MQTIEYLYTKENKIFAELKYTSKIFSDYKRHFHTHLGLALIEDGHLDITYDIDNKVTLDVHSLAIFNPKQIHCTNACDARGYYILFLDTTWCQMLQKEFLFGENILKDKMLYKQLYILFQKVLNTNKVQIEEELKTIITTTFNTYATAPKREEPKLISKIKILIEKKNISTLSVEAIAKYVGYNKSYLIRFFKKEVGLTPQQYILNTKVNRAKELLTYSKKESLSSISLDAGFFDQSHFNRNFKGLFGTTPNRYKKVNIVQDKENAIGYD